MALVKFIFEINTHTLSFFNEKSETFPVIVTIVKCHTSVFIYFLGLYLFVLQTNATFQNNIMFRFSLFLYVLHAFLKLHRLAMVTNYE